jgi:hypothetical protein
VNGGVGGRVKVPVRENPEEKVKSEVGQKTPGTGKCELII